MWAEIPGYQLIERIIDVFATRERWRVIVTSEDYCEVRFLWGAIEFSKGAKREFLIEGGPGFCNAVLRNLEGSQRASKIISKVAGTKKLLQ